MVRLYSRAARADVVAFERAVVALPEVVSSDSAFSVVHDNFGSRDP
ncbi:hypothetical protein [Lentzea sp. NPDC092896]